MEINIKPADVVAATALTGIFVADAWLVRNGHESISERHGQWVGARRARWVVIAWWSYLMLHLHSSLLPECLQRAFRRLDPLGIAARRLRPDTMVS